MSIELETFIESYNDLEVALKNFEIALEDLERAGLGREFDRDADDLRRRVHSIMEDFRTYVSIFIDDKLRDWKILDENKR